MARPRSLVDQIYEQLRNDIITGRIQSSEKLVELEIAERMGTSQGTVREALQRLECDGLVDRQARRALLARQYRLDRRTLRRGRANQDRPLPGRAPRGHVGCARRRSL